MTALARTTDLPASHDAAAVATEQEQIVMAIVERMFLDAGPHGLTDHELKVRYFANLSNPGVDVETPRKRRSQLTGRHLVIVTAERRKSDHERVSSHVWVHRNHFSRDAA